MLSRSVESADRLAAVAQARHHGIWLTMDDSDSNPAGGDATLPNTYDDVPYPSHPYSATHPCHLAKAGQLFGICAPPVRQCRTLELGCASGGNLIPIAQDFPDAQFVGIDLSSQQIADGNRAIQHLGLENIQLHRGSILEIDAGFGIFDYIICHGVYSWVPPEVQEKILLLGRELLSPSGLMYVSYNTFPGWHMRCAVREMMNYHVQRFSQSGDKISQARTLLAFLAGNSAHQSPSFGNLLKEEAELLGGLSDGYLYHEHLETVNDPIYFHQFIERSSHAGLQYLGDAELTSMIVDHFDESTKRVLENASFLEQEQYLDFLRGRMFRSSILCLPGQTPDRRIRVQRLLPMSVRLSEQLRLESESSGGESKFAGPTKTLTTRSNTLKNLVAQLTGCYPNWISVEQLISELTDGETSSRGLHELTQMILRGVLLACVDPPEFVTTVSSHPKVTPLIRYEALRGAAAVTSRLHGHVVVDDPGKYVLVRLDGEHSIAELSNELQSALDRRHFEIHDKDGRPVRRPDLPRALLNERLEYFAANALLIA